jgi:hypothetical protein
LDCYHKISQEADPIKSVVGWMKRYHSSSIVLLGELQAALYRWAQLLLATKLLAVLCMDRFSKTRLDGFCTYLFARLKSYIFNVQTVSD